MDRIKAPFTERQIIALEAWQKNPYLHDLTCCDHVPMRIAARGLICPKCNRVQSSIIDPGDPEEVRNFGFGRCCHPDA